MERHHTTAVRVQGGEEAGRARAGRRSWEQDPEEQLELGEGGAGVLCKDWPTAARLQRMEAQSFRKWVFCGDTASLSLPIAVEGCLCFGHLVKLLCKQHGSRSNKMCTIIHGLVKA